MFHIYLLMFSTCVLFELTFITGESIPNLLTDGRDTSNPKRRCEIVTISLCKDIGYNETTFPNLLHHLSQHNAGLELHKFAPLIKVNCSKDLKLLLCAVFFPPCTILETPLPPCRSICLDSRSGCERYVNAFGYEWPEYLDCSSFPEDQPCISRTGSQLDQEPSRDNTNSTSPSNNGNKNSYTDLTNSIGKAYRFVCPVHYMTPKESGYVLHLNGKSYSDCATPCDGLLFDKHEKQIIRGCIFIFSIICLISSLFTLITHLLEPRRFSYPEKTMKFLAVCYSFIAIVHIIGFSSGDNISCNDPFPPPKDNLHVPMIRTITQGNSKASCTLTFMFLYFFIHSSYVWFTIMAITWFIAFFYGWGREGFERKATWFHIFAWALPAIEAFRILALKQIEGDPLSGICYHDFWNREEPRLFTDFGLYFCYISLSVIFLLIGFYFSCHLHKELKAAGRDTYKMDNLLWRVSIFSIFYLLSSFTLIASNIYEVKHLDSWMLDWQQRICQRPDSGVPCPFLSPDRIPVKPKMQFFILKYAARLVPGIALSFHLLSRKTLDSWLYSCQKFSNWLCCTSENNDLEKSIDE